jgi:hypothetical protein
MRHDSCYNCRWWDSNDELIGQCRRFAPRPIAVIDHDPRSNFPVAEWPTTLAGEFCGDFREPWEVTGDA